MPIAVSVATRSGMAATTIMQLAREAQTAGLDGFYLAESATDSFALCQAALQATDTIAVGTAVANARLRHPFLTATTAALFDELYPGRFRLGLGLSNAHFNETVLGMPPYHPLRFMRDYVATVRSVLGGSPPLDRPVGEPKIPIMIGPTRPRMMRLAGEIADSVTLSITPPKNVPDALALIEQGAVAGGRSLDQITVEAVLPCSFADADEVRRAGRALVVGYAHHPGPAEVFAREGFPEEAERIVATLRGGDVEAALAAVSDEMVDAFVLSGDLDRVLGRVDDYIACGVDRVILFPIASGDRWPESVRSAIEIGGRLTAAGR